MSDTKTLNDALEMLKHSLSNLEKPVIEQLEGELIQGFFDSIAVITPAFQKTVRSLEGLFSLKDKGLLSPRGEKFMTMSEDDEKTLRGLSQVGGSLQALIEDVLNSLKKGGDHGDRQDIT